MQQLDEVGLARNAKVKSAPLHNAQINEIAEILLELGGSAHRDTVIDRIALRRGATRASDGLKQDLLGAVAAHCARADSENQRALLHLPFGADSRRWALMPDEEAIAREQQARAAEMIMANSLEKTIIAGQIAL